MGKIVDALFMTKKPTDVVKLKSELSEQQLMLIQSEQPKYRRSLFFAYLLYFLLGPIGAHKFYVGRRWSGIGYILLLTGIVGLASLMPAGSGWTDNDQILFLVAKTGLPGALIVVLGLALLIDLFTLPKQVRQVWERAEIKIIEKLRSNNSKNT